MNNKLLLQDLTDELSIAGKLKKKDAEEFLRALFKATEEAFFEGEVVKISGLGTFKLLLVDARKSVNVSTGEEFEIKEHYKVAFTPDSTLKDSVNIPFSHLEPVELESGTEKKPAASEKKIIVPEKKAVTPEKRSTAPDQTDETIPAEDEPENNLQKEAIKAVKKEKSKTSPEKSEKKKRPFLGWTIFIVIAAALGIWAWMSNQADLKDYAEKEREIAMLDSLEAASSMTEDSLFEAEKDTTKVAAEKEPTEAVAPAIKPTTTIPDAKPVTTTTKPDASGKSWPVTIKMKQGDRLTLLALEYYGHKAFWVYIYEANKHVIQNPDNVPIGTVIRIPKPNPALINANDLHCISKAKALQFKLLGH
jgi:nucleoid DNA-binding protein/nucleoid-associated protein YgaU